MRPTAADYEALGDDRAERFAAVVGIEAQELLAVARAQPGVEARRVIGTTQPVGLVVHVVDTLEETYTAVFGDTTGPAQFALLLDPDGRLDDVADELAAVGIAEGAGVSEFPGLGQIMQE